MTTVTRNTDLPHNEAVVPRKQPGLPRRHLNDLVRALGFTLIWSIG